MYVRQMKTTTLSRVAKHEDGKDSAAHHPGFTFPWGEGGRGINSFLLHMRSD